MDALAINSTETPAKGVVAVSHVPNLVLTHRKMLLQAIDSGTTLIYVPARLAAAFYDSVRIYPKLPYFPMTRNYRSLVRGKSRIWTLVSTIYSSSIHKILICPSPQVSMPIHATLNLPPPSYLESKNLV